MAAEDRKAALKKCYEEAYHHGNFAPLDELADEGMVDHSVYRDPKAVPGLAGFKQRPRCLSQHQG